MSFSLFSVIFSCHFLSFFLSGFFPVTVTPSANYPQLSSFRLMVLSLFKGLVCRLSALSSLCIFFLFMVLLCFKLVYLFTVTSSCAKTEVRLLKIRKKKFKKQTTLPLGYDKWSHQEFLFKRISQTCFLKLRLFFCWYFLDEIIFLAGQFFLKQMFFF